MKASLVTLAATLAVTNGMNGEEACENRGLDQQQCADVGCCHYNPELGCMSSVGQSTCHDNAENEEFDVPLGLDLGRRLDESLIRRLDKPTHKELHDLARLTEDAIAMDTEEAEEVMKMTGLTEESMVEIGRDIVIDAMADLPDGLFLKIQRDILMQRLGYAPEDLLDDMDMMHKQMPEDRRRMEKDWKFWVNFSAQAVASLGGLITGIAQQFPQ